MKDESIIEILDKLRAKIELEKLGYPPIRRLLQSHYESVENYRFLQTTSDK